MSTLTDDPALTLIHAPYIGDMLALLNARGYAPADRRAIVEHAAEFGTVNCCPRFRNGQDRDDCEAIIPLSASWAERDFDSFYWATY